MKASEGGEPMCGIGGWAKRGGWGAQGACAVAGGAPRVDLDHLDVEDRGERGAVRPRSSGRTAFYQPTRFTGCFADKCPCFVDACPCV